MLNAIVLGFLLGAVIGMEVGGGVIPEIFLFLAILGFFLCIAGIRRGGFMILSALWTFYWHSHATKNGFEIFQTTFFEELKYFFRGLFYKNLNRYPLDMQRWLRAFVFGEQNTLNHSQIREFRSIGLLHALVLSGGHLSILIASMGLIVRMPFQLLYILRRLDCKTWVAIWGVADFISLGPLYFFCLAVGFTPTIQRAFISAFFMILLPMVGAPHKALRRLKIIFMVQSLLFPGDIFTLSSILSWSGVFILRAWSGGGLHVTLRQRLTQGVTTQMFFFGLTLITFGSVGVLSVLANILFVPVLGWLLVQNIASLFSSSEIIINAAIWSNRSLLSCISSFSQWQERLPISQFMIPEYLTIAHLGGRILFLGFIFGLFFLMEKRWLFSHKAP